MNGISDQERLEELRERRDSAAKDLEWALQEALAATLRVNRCMAAFYLKDAAYKSHAEMMAQMEEK